MYTPPAPPELLTPYPSFINPDTLRPALTFHMRFTTHGSNLRTARLLEAIGKKWFPDNVPVNPGDDMNAVSLLSIILPLTARIDFDFEAYDIPELRGFAWYWDWVGRDIYLDASAREEITDDEERLAAVWELFNPSVGTLVQREWRLAYNKGQTKFPAKAEMRVMTAEQEKVLEKTDPDFLDEEKPPVASSA